MKKFLRFISGVTLCIFSLTNVVPNGYAAEMFLPPPNQMLNVSQDFTPVILRGMVINQRDPLKFDFLMDTGTSKPSGAILKQEAEKSIKYFLASLTVADRDQWVNLSPDEKDRVIPDSFGQTVMGRDLLSEDYILKQLSSSLLYPENAVGKEFWSKVYAAAAAKYGTSDINIGNFNRVWIAPAEARVWEHDGKVVILKSRLKVVLEADYLAAGKAAGQAVSAQEATDQIMRDILIPVLEKEVNEGAHFARLRQIYAAMILSSWYKERLQESLLAQAYADQGKVRGVGFRDSVDKERIYRQYLEAVNKGVYSYVKEDVDSGTGLAVPRKYFSGGFSKSDFFHEQYRSGALVAFGPVDALSAADRADAGQVAHPRGTMLLVSAGVRDVGPVRQLDFAQGTSPWAYVHGKVMKDVVFYFVLAVFLFGGLAVSYELNLLPRPTTVPEVVRMAEATNEAPMYGIRTYNLLFDDQGFALKDAEAVLVVLKEGRIMPTRANEWLAVNKISKDRIIAVNVELLSSTNAQVRLEAIQYLGENAADAKIKVAISDMLKKEADQEVVKYAQIAMEKIDNRLSASFIFIGVRLVALFAGLKFIGRRSGDIVAVRLLTKKFLASKDPAKRVKALQYLIARGDIDDADLLLERTADVNSEVRALAMAGLKALDMRSYLVLGNLHKLSSAVSEIQQEGVSFFRESGNKTADLPVLVPFYLLGHPSQWQGAEQARLALGATDEEMGLAIKAYYKNKPQNDAAMLNVIINRMPWFAGRWLVLMALTSKSRANKMRALYYFLKHRDKAGIAVAARLCADQDIKLREYARKTMKILGADKATIIRANVAAMKAQDAAVRKEAVVYLKRIIQKSDLEVLAEALSASDLFFITQIEQLMKLVGNDKEIQAARFNVLFPDWQVKDKFPDFQDKAQANALGGIDMDRGKLDLQIHRDGNGLSLPMDQPDWTKINVHGFAPIIYRIEPVNMGLILGLKM